MKNFIFLLTVLLILILGVACKKNEVVSPEASGGSPNMGNPNKLDSVAIFNLVIPANTPPSVALPPRTGLIPGTRIYDTKYYSYFVTFSVYPPEDINYSGKPLYTVTSDTSALPPTSTTSTPIQVVLSIKLPSTIKKGCIQRSVFSVTQYEQINQVIKRGTQPLSDTTFYTSTNVGGEIYGSGNCESFTQGQIGDIDYMIFSQTGTATY